MRLVLRYVARWPFSTWWLLGVLTRLAEHYSYTYFNTGYDDGGLGSFIFLLSVFTVTPIELAKEMILACRGSAVVTPYDPYLAVAIAGLFCLALDIVLQRLFRRFK